jgi:hypothetical protein
MREAQTRNLERVRIFDAPRNDGELAFVGGRTNLDRANYFICGSS